MPSILSRKGAHASPAAASRWADGTLRTVPKEIASNAVLSSYLTPSEQLDFVALMLEVNVKRGDVVIRQGEKGNNFFLVAQGQCIVSKDGNPIRMLTAGANCGELGLLENAERTVSVIASSEHVKLLLMHRTNFMRLLGNRMLEKRQQVLPFLERVPVFAKIKAYELHALADTAVIKTYAPGAVLAQRGDTIDCFRLVREGCVSSSNGTMQHVCDHFGEVEIFTKRTSELTMTASSVRGAICLEWSVGHFVAYVSLNAFLEEKLQQEVAMARTDPTGTSSRARRMAESAEASNAKVKTASVITERVPVQGAHSSVVPQGRPVAGRPQQVALNEFRAACKKVLVFARLDDDQLDQLHAVMVEHAVDAGTVVLVEGEKGNRFYFVASGILDAFSSSNTANDGLVRSFQTGDSFGELALMYNCPRTATVVSRTNSVLWSLDRATFRRILLAENLRKASMYEKFLEKVPLLQPLSRVERNRIVDALEPISFAGGERIITEGELGEHFYLIETGSVNVTSAAHGKLATRSTGDYFGEVSLQTGAPTIASVTAVGMTKLVRMAREAFIRVLGPLAQHDAATASAKSSRSRRGSHAGNDKASFGMAGVLDLRHYDASTGKEVDACNVDTSTKSPSSTPCKPSSPPLLDLPRVSARASPDAGTQKNNSPSIAAKFDVSSFLVAPEPIGEGGFGKVLLAEHVSTRKRYAIKQMSKAHLVRMGQAEHATDESLVLDGTESCRFIAHKAGSFQTSSHLFLLLELASGGDMYDLLEDHGGKIGVSDARAYIAQLLIALEFLHSRSVVHRDVKLENLLLAADGTLKLSDFGFAKIVEYRTFTLCGTPEYLAPEVILNKGYGRGVDFWACGIVLYEMIAGTSPFAADDHLATYQNILYGSLKFPAGFPTKAADLISRLLERDITKRYGLLKRGVADIKNHWIFQGYDWERMPSASTRPLNMPEYTGVWMPLADISDSQAERGSPPLSPKEQAMFVGF